MKPVLPRRVFEKHGAYYHVTAMGEKRKWTKLCRVKEGTPALYKALAEMAASEVMDDSMARLMGEWLNTVSI